MTSPAHSNKRIAINTGVIYFRLILTLGISLYSTRFVLEALGADDYGLYNVVAGVVAMFAFISATMATSTQRFISFSMGLGNGPAEMKKVVGSAISIHLLMAVLVSAIVLLGGWWAINHMLDIPYGKTPDALFVLVCVVVGLVGTINSVPFEALLMAHENILYVSICQTVNALFKFGAAVVLLGVPTDRLRLYAVLMAVLPFIILILEAAYCLAKYSETRVSRTDFRPGTVMKELSKFAGWVMIGTTCMTLRNQGVAIILNIFWGVAVNAANAVANQVNSTLQFFSTSVTTSLRPQLVRSAGEGDYQRMMTLMTAASKYPLLLIILAASPIIVAMPYILSLWLKTVPDHTVTFCRIMLLSTIVGQAYMGIVNGMEAMGKVKLMHIFCGSAYLAVLPTGYILARQGFDPQCVYWCVVFFQIVILAYLIHLAGRQLNLDKKRFSLNVVGRSAVVAVLLTIADFFIWNYLSPSLLSLVTLGVADIVVFALLCYTIGFTGEEKRTVSKLVSKLSGKVSKNKPTE